MDLQPLQIDRSKERAKARRSPSPGRWFGRILVLGLLAGVVALFWRPLKERVDRLRLPEVRVLQVSRSSPLTAAAVQGTAANGYVVARTRAALSADTPGRIVEMNVTEGQIVPKGFVVARLFAEEYQALFERAQADLDLTRKAQGSAEAARQVAEGGVAQARARIVAAEADLEDGRVSLSWSEIEQKRVTQLLEERIASQGEFDEVSLARDRARARLVSLEASLEVAREGLRSAELQLVLAASRVAEAAGLVRVKQADLEQARATLGKTEVRAPFDGVVVLKDAEVGEVVSPNAVGSQSRGSVATMVDPKTFEVQVEVPETSLSGVRLDASARIFLDAYPEFGYAGRVLRIWPTANRQKATVEVRVGFDAPDERLRPEMGARIVFSSGEETEAGDAEPAESGTPVILVPRSALVTVDGGAHVFVLERDVARLRAVQLGEERSGRVVCEGGLTSGERIIDSPPNSLRDGDRVRASG